MLGWRGVIVYLVLHIITKHSNAQISETDEMFGRYWKVTNKFTLDLKSRFHYISIYPGCVKMVAFMTEYDSCEYMQLLMGFVNFTINFPPFH